MICSLEMVDNAGVDDDIADDVTNHDFVYEFDSPAQIPLKPFIVSSKLTKTPGDPVKTLCDMKRLR